MVAHSHTELVAWKLADELRREVYDLFSDGPPSRDFRLRSQAEDAASSICRNLSEGFYLFSPPQFAKFARYAAGSIGELASVIEDGVAKQHWTKERVNRAENLVKRTGTAVGRLQRYLRSPRARRNAARILQKNSGAEPEP